MSQILCLITERFVIRWGGKYQGKILDPKELYYTPWEIKRMCALLEDKKRTSKQTINKKF